MGDSLSKIHDLVIDIQDRLRAGQDPEYISKWLEIPLSWVTDTLDSMMESDEPDNSLDQEL